MKKLLMAAIALLLLLAASASCSKAPASVPDQARSDMKALSGTTVTQTATRTAPTPTPAPLPPGTAGTVQTDRMIVRTGQMSLLVTDIPAAIDQIARLAESYKGYVVSSQSWREDERLRGTITIRIPAGDFGNVMKAIGELAVEVVTQTTSSKDVTEEYVDLSAQLHNLEASEQQLLRIMEKAEKVEDILSIQRELSKTRGEIEQTKARMLYLERTSATSLVEISLEQSKLSVKFTADRRFLKAGEGISLRSQVAGGFAPYSYQWDFGDEGTSTEPTPAHTYKSPGTYTVSLKVTDDRGNTDTETTKDYITAASGWEAGNTARSAWNGLVVFSRVLTDILLWLGIFSPVWIVAGGGIYLWRRLHRKKVYYKEGK